MLLSDTGDRIPQLRAFLPRQVAYKPLLLRPFYAISIARSEKNEHESTKTAKFSLGKIHHSLGKSSKIQSLSRKKSFLAFWAKKDFFGKKSSRPAEKSISTSEKV